MTTRDLRPGDKIEVDVNGRPFIATFLEKLENGLCRIDPPDGFNYFRARPRDIRRRVP